MLARLAGQYRLKTAQADEAAMKLRLNLRRGAAKVAPWQGEACHTGDHSYFGLTAVKPGRRGRWILFKPRSTDGPALS
jgi:hypothetical protein